MSTAPSSPRKINPKREQAALEYRQTTDTLKFSKDFNSSLGAIMHDPLATWSERFTAWLKRYSWGEYSLYAIDAEGNPRTLADAAKELAGSDPPPEKVAHSPYKLTSVRARLSHAAAYMEARNYLRREGKRLYPVIAPQASPPPEKVADSRTFSKFLEHYKVAHSCTFSELEIARSKVKTIQKSILSEYKKWRSLQQNEGATLLTKSKERRKNERAGGSVAVVTEAPAPAPTPAEPARPPASPLSSHKAKPNPNPSAPLLAPIRPSGTLAVMLEYAGRGTPSSESGVKPPAAPVIHSTAAADISSDSPNGAAPHWQTGLEKWLNEHGRIGTLIDPLMLEKIASRLSGPELLEPFYREALKVENPRKYSVYETVAGQVYARAQMPQNGRERAADESRERVLASSRSILADPTAPAYRRKMARDLLEIETGPRKRKPSTVRYVDPDTGEIVVLNQTPKRE